MLGLLVLGHLVSHLLEEGVDPVDGEEDEDGEHVEDVVHGGGGEPRGGRPCWPKCPMAAMVLVTEVPMLAPMIMKMAMLTELISSDEETMMDVVVDEDWTSTVARIPSSARR